MPQARPVGSLEFIMKWIKKAEEDLDAADKCAGLGLYAASCFFSQQAAEMALRGYFIFRTGLQPFTHSLVELAERSGREGLAPLPDADDLRWLQDHYLQARYPNARISPYTGQEALRALALAKRVVEVVKGQLER
jgi:HEPN domain-containing protein